MKRLWMALLSFVLIGILVIVFVNQTQPPVKRTFLGFDTWIDIELPSAHQSIFPELETMIKDWDRLWNRYEPNSLIWQLNRTEDWIQVDRETFKLFQLSKRFEELTGGYFTITIGSLVDLWAVSSDQPAIPLPEELGPVIELTAKTEVELREADRSIRRTGKGALDLGGIAKGYLVDLLKACFHSEQISPVLINAGGSVYSYGRSARVGIPHPRDETLLGAITLKNQAISTSGDYYRYFDYQGRRYHHILNPFDGYPNQDFSSVTVVANTGVESDVLSTAIMAGGREVFERISEQFPELAIIAVDQKGNPIMTQSGKERLTPFE